MYSARRNERSPDDPKHDRSAAEPPLPVPGKRTLTEQLTGPAGREAAPGPSAPAGRAASPGPGHPVGGARPSLDALFGARGAGADGGGPGRLPAELDARMSRAFGSDFSHVRVHTDSAEAPALGARAFTRGSELHFAPGQWSPDTERGQQLIGHELAHVVQQAQGRVAAPQAKPGDLGLAASPAARASVNADAALEAEADALGARAARGEVVAHAGVAPRGGAGYAVQRFKDPVSEEDVDIDSLGRDAVEKYLDLIQNKELKVTADEFRRLSLRRKAYMTDRAMIGEANRQGMNAANAGTGPSYLHNVGNEQRAELVQQGIEPSLGYADPTYFERESKFTWRAKPRVSAAAAIRAFLRPGTVTIAECQTVLQAVFYHTVLRAVGDARFDAVLGEADRETAKEARLLLQMDFTGKNPLGNLLEPLLDGAPVSLDRDHPHAMSGGPSDHLGLDREERGHLTKDRDGGLVSGPDHRPVKLGGWYYMKNHEFYTERHKGGLWAGENALYVGRDPEGHQVFSGFGLANRTEEQMAAAMATETNRPPSAERAAQLFKQGKFGLALPVLGSISSVDQMTLTDEMVGIIDDLWRAEHKDDPHSANPGIAKQRFKTLLGAMELPGPVTAADILTQQRLGEMAQGIGAEQNEQNRQLKLRGLTLSWETGEHPSGAACAIVEAETSKPSVRVPCSDLIKYYAEQYGLEYLAADMQSAFRVLNEGVPDNIDMAKKKTYKYYFPLPSVFIKRVATASGFQMLGGKNLSPDKIKQVFGVDTLFEGEL